VSDADSGELLPCRIHFRTADGIPYAPHGHHSHINSDLGTWNLDIGGDVRLGGAPYAYIAGECEGWLPVGPILVEVARGFEYQPLRLEVEIAPGEDKLELRLHRVDRAAGAGWVSGDMHAHFLSTQAALLEARGEGLAVVNLLQTQWTHLFSNLEDFTGRPAESADGSTIVFVGQENRQHVLGHLILLGLQRPIMPWCTGGAEEAELGGSLDTTLSHWADECHAQGGTVVLPHFPCPYGETPVLVATGRADAIEMIVDDEYNLGEYYRYLNAGFQLPLTAGTDKMTAEVPLGLYRTYVEIPDGEPFSFESWCEGIRAGRTYATGGPLLSFEVDGQPAGSTLKLSPEGGTVSVRARATSIFPIQTLQLVANGAVVAESVPTVPTDELELSVDLPVSEDTWLAVRAAGPGFTREVHRDIWARGVFAHSSPAYVACGDSYERTDADVLRHMLAIVDGAASYLRERAPLGRPGVLHHRHGEDDHLAFLLRPFDEARLELGRQLKRAGLKKGKAA
jgi:hypothetical protein